MAKHTQDEYKPLNFYAKNSKPKKAGFSKFRVADSYYFCRYVDGKIALISQAYTSQPGRDNGVESVKKNEKLAKRYSFNKRGATAHGFSLKAGNGQEIAISPNYPSRAATQNVASRMSGAKFSSKAPVKTSTTEKSAAKKSAPTKATPKKATPKKDVPQKSAVKKAPTKAASSTAKDGRIENYRPLSFYRKHGTMKDGFNQFEHDGAFYFHYSQNDRILLISESYTSKAGRNNGIESVKKNKKLKSAYQYHLHKNGKHYFDLNAANKQEIATSRWFVSKSAANNAAANLRGETPKPPRTSNDEDNYPPLAFYRKHSKGKKKGFEKFKGSDGEYYFTYFENSKLALISEGYPKAAIRDKGLASVEKNMKIEKRYVQGTGADGKPGFIIRAGNNKEIARSVGYGSAAAAVAGAAYLLGTRRRVPAKSSGQAKAKPVTKPKKPAASKAKTSLAGAGVAAAGLAAKKPKPKPKVTSVKKASVPVKAAPVAKAPKSQTPKTKPKPKPKQVATTKKLAAGTVAAAGLAGKAAATAKPAAVKAPTVPVKAAAAVTPKPKAEAAAAQPKAAPIAAAAPVAAPAAAAPIAAAAAAPVEAAVTGGSGIWGWLKWLLLALLALLAIFFLIKACAGGGKDAATPAPAVTESAAPAAMASCWDGSKAKNDAACPAKITCWDNSFATSDAACPARPVAPAPSIAKDYACWDGSKAVDLAGCPIKPAPPEPVKATSAKMTAPSVSGRFCGPSPNVLFDVSSGQSTNVTYLGSNPQFGNSQGLTPSEFFNRLQERYAASLYDRSFLNLLATSLGYSSFQNMDASMFSNDTLAQGSSGLLGFGSQHALQYSTLNMTDVNQLNAFKVRSANGTDVHFMKQCGNFMYVCQP